MELFIYGYKLTPDKVRKIANFANKLRTIQCSIRDLASFIGIALSSKDGFYYAPLFYRNLQFNLNKLRNKEENWDAYAQLTPEYLQDLSWWEKLEDHDLKPVQINPPDHNISVFTDASKTGWGASIQGGKSYSGKWSNYEQNQHINWLELKAVQLTVLECLPDLIGKSITISSDNASTVFYLNNMGGTHSYKLCCLAIEIHLLLKEHHILITAKHVAGIHNIKADYLSRYSHLHEYSLHHSTFLDLTYLIPFQLEVDLFASHENNKLEKFASLNKSESVIAVDAFSINWASFNGIYLYIYICIYINIYK